ncbi:hypothetical protein RHGRI_004757 [Rhododendron griersonianum]|uniref:Uncharacterized protein n=1 Tax=Rhododendron griersonianum TaxID=479676 RepID=A0AAV6LAU9_9ERIC|nr:hypothetical protein RHGRI_004757 [Rhododendron griersonianum]
MSPNTYLTFSTLLFVCLLLEEELSHPSTVFGILLIDLVGMLPLCNISVPFKHVALSSSPKDPNSSCTVMVLTVTEKIDSHFRITSLGTNRVVPSVPAMHFKEY